MKLQLADGTVGNINREPNELYEHNQDAVTKATFHRRSMWTILHAVYTAQQQQLGTTTLIALLFH